MNSLTMLTVEQWEETYKPMVNVLDPNASWDGIMFETYGEEHRTVKKYPNERIWTYAQGDEGLYLFAGYHIVNRIGYFICEVPWEDKNIEVLVHKDGWDGHLRNLTSYQLAEIMCNECNRYSMVDTACITAMKNNEAICNNCCECCE